MSSSCPSGKIPYETQAQAAKAMHRAVGRRGKKHIPGAKVAPYKCKLCDAYHWGHHGNKTSPNRKPPKRKRPHA